MSGMGSKKRTRCDETVCEPASPAAEAPVPDSQPSQLTTVRTADTQGDAPIRLLASHELLGQGRRVWIEHDSRRYLLQVTKSNKLILTK